MGYPQFYTLSQNSRENIFAGVKVAGLKAWNFIKKRLCSGIFLWILCNFSKTIFTEHLRLTALADSSFLTEVLSTDHTLFAFSFIFFLLLFIIAVMGVYKFKSLEMQMFLIFAIVYSKINMNVVKTILPR